ncbi:MAG: restriction endonuclease subunit S [Sulfuricella sp.]
MNKATRELLEAHFDTAFAAPDGIKKLRELILTLAMQGKLVAQEPSDLPASQLLKEIEAEKKRLVKAGKIKAPKPLPEIKAEEVPYALPQGWEWVRLGDISEYIQRGKGPAYSEIPEIPVISQKCVQWGGFNKSVVRFIDPSTLDAYQNERFIRNGDLLWNSTGTGTIGRVNLYADELSEFSHVVADSHVTVVRLIGLCNSFVLSYLMSPAIQSRIEENASGTTNQIELNTTTVINQAVPLPPLPEQERIVAKIDQLMTRCDELEKLRDEQEQKRRSVHTAALKQLLDAQAGDNFADAWQFITKHFGELYTVRENVTELRKAILQLAVMGKLVPQNPNDPPASKLLKEIEAEKKRLVKEGKIKAPKPLPEIQPEEVPYALPQGWQWTTLAEVGLINPRNVAQDSTSVSFVPMTLIGKDLKGSHQQEERIWADVKQGFTHFAEGDIGVAKITPCFENSKACVFSGLINGLGAGTTELHIVRPVEEKIASRFVLAYLKSPQFLLIGETKMTGTAGQKRLPKEFIETNPLPLPPLPEQHRIVAKIDQLMSLCDTLEQQIAAATSKQTALLDAVMAQV